MDAAVLFDADAFRMDGDKLMGRQAAGNGFLRAMVAANAGGELWGFSPGGDAAEDFARTVAEVDPSVRTQWIARGDLAAMAARRVLFRPDATLLDMANLRLRSGMRAYSICGLTHSLSGPPLEVLARYAAAPFAPWDALVCTSRAAVSVVEQTLAAEADYLAWRFGQGVSFVRPQLPVIPLGVHCADFEGRPAKRPAARARLGLADEEVAVLFAGRFSFHAKAHPYQMFAGLQAAAERTGKKIALVLAGQAHRPQVLDLFREAMAGVCPGVRPVIVDGKDFEAYAAAWSAADIFVSLSDNIQETFGITPVEAMASGLPVVVSDWDGYRDTVRDGVDGFRIPTFAPAPGAGEHIAAAYESGALNYDFMLYRTCMAVGVDFEVLVEKLSALVSDGELRARMGQAGLERARTQYDWAVVYRTYQTLWDELDAIRIAEGGKAPWTEAPRNATGDRDPFQAFAAYPTAHLGPQTVIALRPGASAEAYRALEASPLFEHWKIGGGVVEAIFGALAVGEATIAGVAEAAQLTMPLACEVTGRLVKMGLVRVAR